MTDDEMQRSIEFLLKSQANLEIQVEKTNQQLEQTNQQLDQTNQQLGRTDLQVERTSRQAEETERRLSMLAETQSEFIQAMLRHVESQAQINADFRRTMKELAEGQRELTQTVSGLVKTVYGSGNPPQG